MQSKNKHAITLEEACVLHEKYGFEFVVEDGEITDVSCS